MITVTVRTLQSSSSGPYPLLRIQCGYTFTIAHSIVVLKVFGVAWGCCLTEITPDSAFLPLDPEIHSENDVRTDCYYISIRFLRDITPNSDRNMCAMSTGSGVMPARC